MEEKFLIAGYGVKAFFDITKMIIKMMVFMTIVYIPIVYLYSQGEAFTEADSMVL